MQAQFVSLNSIRFWLILSTLIWGTGCQTMWELRMHRNDLNGVVQADLSTPERFDATAEILANVLDGATSRPSAYKTFRYLDRFSKKNLVSLNQLHAEFQPWLADMNRGEKLGLAAKALTKPYGRKLMVQVPKVSQMMDDNGYKLNSLEKLLLLFRLRKTIKKNKK